MPRLSPKSLLSAVYAGCAVLCLLVPAATASAKGEFLRGLSFAWEPIPGAKGYELELWRETTDRRQNYTTKRPKWESDVAPGRYKIRLRTLDSRKVPGPWSPWVDLALKYEAIETLRPKAKSRVRTDEQKSADTNFRWKPVCNDCRYLLKIMDSQDQVVKEVTVDEAQATVNLPVAQAYQFQVQAMGEGELAGDLSDPTPFQLIGAALEQPAMEQEHEPDSPVISWTKSDYAEHYQIRLVVRNKESGGKWRPLKAEGEYDSQVVAIKPDWPFGQYRLVVIAKAPYRRPSKRLVYTFMRKPERKAAPKSATAIAMARPSHSFQVQAGYTPSYRNLRVASSDLRSDLNLFFFDAFEAAFSYTFHNPSQYFTSEFIGILQSTSIQENVTAQSSSDSSTKELANNVYGSSFGYGLKFWRMAAGLELQINQRQVQYLYRPTQLSLGIANNSHQEAGYGANVSFMFSRGLINLSYLTASLLKTDPLPAQPLADHRFKFRFQSKLATSYLFLYGFYHYSLFSYEFTEEDEVTGVDVLTHSLGMGLGLSF